LSYVFSYKFGSFGDGPRQFNQPICVALDSSANVFVTDGSNHRIQKFETKGIFTTKWGSHGSADGQFRYPFGIAVKPAKISFLEERVFVADSDNHRIQVFKPKLVVNP